MIGLDMEMLDTCWSCKLRYGHYETKCFLQTGAWMTHGMQKENLLIVLLSR